MEEKGEKVFGRLIERNYQVISILLDTNVLIDNVEGFAEWLDYLLVDKDKYNLIVPAIVIAEYLTSQEHEIAKAKEKSYKYLSSFKVQDLNFQIAEELGKILRRKTYTSAASMADLIIAATAVYLDVRLATRNKGDFAKIPGLRFFDPKNV